LHHLHELPIRTVHQNRLKELSEINSLTTSSTTTVRWLWFESLTVGLTRLSLKQTTQPHSKPLNIINYRRKIILICL